jgi:Fe-S cluster assembly protein SufB
MRQNDNLDFDYKYGFVMPEVATYKSQRGINRDVVSAISKIKQEPDWMTKFRLNAFKSFVNLPMPKWGPDLSEIDFQDLTYFLRPTDRQSTSWDDLPSEIKDTYDRIGVPEAEKKYLAGVSAQYDSEVVYESVQKILKKQGVIFCDMDSAVRLYPDLVKRYIGTLIAPNDNKFASLNSAVWSGGSFVYVPKGVEVKLPLQAYFRINSERFGQFERTLIIAEADSKVNYIEGCTAPTYRTNSLHAAVVEIFAMERSKVRYTTVQNWSKNIYNLVTKRSIARANAHMEWIDCNIGSKVTMKYPSIYLVGDGARGEVLSIAFSGANQQQDTGAKIFHKAPNTTSRVVSKSISKLSGRSSYRGLIDVSKHAKSSKVYVSCDAMLIGNASRSDTYPMMKICSKDTEVQHEATVERLGEEKIFYLMSRGINKSDAEGLIANGFIQPVSREIPFEYAVELNRLINLEMKGSVG